MSKDVLYITHISESIGKIRRYTSQGKDHFLADAMVQDAVIRNFEIIGEAAKKLSAAFRSNHPGVPWRQIAGLRDVLIHDYMGVDLIEVWNIIENDLPGLESALDRIRK